ncbi:MAG: MurR/RpiR family transcriptional regulator [Tractidigestivibacter sp.]|jgi:RpiR family carbohydrate utilization transcriptional regulator|uniref:MurR/RpiR family transcriptional regulator n=1 Tax=Tractidigestivibacter sp. TaxID=2847320 RepID=UPI003D8A62FE
MKSKDTGPTEGTDGLARNIDQPDSGEDLVMRMLSLVDSMPSGERAIAEWLLRHQSGSIGLSQADLAKLCGVSPATVSRFCKRVGEKDYHTFQMSLLRSQERLHGSSTPDAADAQISAGDTKGALQTLLQGKIADMTSTIDSLPIDDLDAVVKLICKARVLEIAATGRTLPVALDAAYKFERVGILSTTSMYYEKLLSAAALLKKGDVLLVISRSGWSGVLQQVVHAAQDHGATIVTITANRNAPISQKSDYVFLATANDSSLDGKTGNSRITEMLVIEAIYHLVCMRKSDAIKHLEAHDKYALTQVDLP